MVHLCLKCYYKFHKEDIRGNIIHISNEKEKCDNCFRNEYVVINRTNGYVILNDAPTFFFE